MGGDMQQEILKGLKLSHSINYDGFKMSYPASLYLNAGRKFLKGFPKMSFYSNIPRKGIDC